MERNEQNKLEIIFYKNLSGNEPVREWLKNLSKEDNKIILLNGFIKKTQTTPRKEINLAKTRYKEIKSNG